MKPILLISFITSLLTCATVFAQHAAGHNSHDAGHGMGHYMTNENSITKTADIPITPTAQFYANCPTVNTSPANNLTNCSHR